VGARLLVMGAGTGAGNNLVASLRAGVPGVMVLGAHTDAFTLRKSTADRRHLLEGGRRAADEIAALADAEAIDLIIPTSDGDVMLLSTHRETLRRRVFLPSRAVIDLCQDKCELAAELARHSVPVPVSLPLSGRETADEVVAKLAWAPRLWCRMRAGTRSLGATPVTSAEQVRSWLLLWEELRGVPANAFMLAEYLPGRDFLCQSLWHDGRLVLVKTFERISYFGGENSPSGTSSLSSLAKTVVDERVVDVCTRAIRALEPGANGAFSIDLKENAEGVPCVTEINAGRFFIGMTALDGVGRHNMSACFVRLALGEELAIEDPYDCPPDHYLVRDLDTPPGVFHADDIFDGLA
jgi:carbamoylphosphate synthase large subunit